MPPNTTSEPVEEDVEFTFPVTSTSLANNEAPIPTPPANTTEPVVVEVELVVLLNVVEPVTPRPPVTLTFAPALTAPVRVDTPATDRVEPNTAAALTVNPPVTPKPPAAIFTLDANDATPVTLSVVLPINGPTEVREVWKVDAPVTPIPPEVTNTAALCVATPAKVEVDTNVALPLAVNPPVTPKPPPAILTLDANEATPVTDNVDPRTAAPLAV